MATVHSAKAGVLQIAAFFEEAKLAKRTWNSSGSRARYWKRFFAGQLIGSAKKPADDGIESDRIDRYGDALGIDGDPGEVGKGGRDAEEADEFTGDRLTEDAG